MHEQIELAMLLYTYTRSSRRKEISTTVDYISASPPAAYRPRVLTSSVVLAMSLISGLHKTSNCLNRLES